MGKTEQVSIETFGEFLRRMRGQRTKSDLARELGVSYVYVGMIERGERHPPPDRLKQICRHFGEPYAKWKRTIDWELEKDETIRQVKAYDVLYHWYGHTEPLRIQRKDGLEIALGVKGEVAETRRVIEPNAPDEWRGQGFAPVPILSLAQCGQWTEFTDSDYPVGVADEYEPSGTRDPNAFFVRAEGLSMTRAGIDPGDLLLVEPAKAEKIRNGSVVLAITEKGQSVKRFYDAGETIILQPDGVEGDPLTVDKTPKDPPDRFYPVTEVRKVLG